MRQADHRSARSGTDLPGTLAVDTVADDAWDDEVRRLGGDAVYHSLGYHRASALLEPVGTRPVLVGDGAGALPLLLRPLGGGLWDATSAYGYGGPLGVPDGPALDAWARAQGVVASFLRYHPLLGNHARGPAGVSVTLRGADVAWDLRGHRDLAASMHEHHRRAVRKATRAGVQVAVTVAPTNLRVFRALYELTMRRQGADPFYFFPTPYWQALVASCRDRLVLFEAFLADEPVAALLCFDADRFVHYHLGASSDAARRVCASNLLFLTAARWGRERGAESFFLGGGLGGSTSSSLFAFKHRFDPATPPVPWHTGAWVHDPVRYRALTGTDSVAGFFPPWRAPGARPVAQVPAQGVPAQGGAAGRDRVHRRAPSPPYPTHHA